METGIATRRQFLKGAGGATLGLVVVSGVGGLLASCTKNETPGATAAALPWPYKKIDPVAAAERGYAAYSEAGCMYGAFEGIIGELRASVGGPYETFPAKMMKYGRAGVVGWGTLCGVLNGAAAAAYLIHNSPEADPIVHEMYGWYGAEMLPNYKPRNPKFQEIAATVSNSPLCHASVTTWCNASGFATHSPERGERCAWLTASTVKHLAELLNQQAEGSFALVHANPEEVAMCLSCHGNGGTVDNVHIDKQASCVICHDAEKHPIPLKQV